MIERHGDYLPGSLGAEINQICDELNDACPGAGDLMFTERVSKLNAILLDGLAEAWRATA